MMPGLHNVWASICINFTSSSIPTNVEQPFSNQHIHNANVPLQISTYSHLFEALQSYIQYNLNNFKLEYKHITNLFHTTFAECISLINSYKSTHIWLVSKLVLDCQVVSSSLGNHFNTSSVNHIFFNIHHSSQICILAVSATRTTRITL